MSQGWLSTWTLLYMSTRHKGTWLSLWVWQLTRPSWQANDRRQVVIEEDQDGTSWSWVLSLNVTFFLSFTLLHTDTLDCLLSSLPHPLLRASVLLWSDLTDMIPSHHLMPCMISIWQRNMILPALLYDTHLGATHTTTSSIGGVQIPIYLVSSTTESL